jgi:hypothetical protein
VIDKINGIGSQLFITRSCCFEIGRRSVNYEVLFIKEAPPQQLRLFLLLVCLCCLPRTRLVVLAVVLSNTHDNLADTNGLYFCCEEAYPRRNQEKV